MFCVVVDVKLNDTWKRLAAAVLCASTLAACGADVATGTKKKKLPALDPTPGEYVGDPGTIGTQPAGAKAEDPAARELINKTVAAVRGLPGYQLDMKWMQKQGSNTARGLYDIIGKAPRTTRIDIKEGKGKGTKVLYTGGSTAKVRPDGFLSAVTVDLAVTDDRLLSVRDYTIPQTDMKALMDQFVDPRHTAKLLGQGMFGGTAVEVAGGPLLKGCVKMVVEVDPATGLPKLIDQYDAKEVVFRLEIKNMRARKSASVDI